MDRDDETPDEEAAEALRVFTILYATVVKIWSVWGVHL